MVQSAEEVAIEMSIDLEPYMGWTPEDFQRNEELFIRNNFPMEEPVKKENEDS